MPVDILILTFHATQAEQIHNNNLVRIFFPNLIPVNVSCMVKRAVIGLIERFFASNPENTKFLVYIGHANRYGSLALGERGQDPLDNNDVFNLVVNSPCRNITLGLLCCYGDLYRPILQIDPIIRAQNRNIHVITEFTNFRNPRVINFADDQRNVSEMAIYFYGFRIRRLYCRHNGRFLYIRAS